MEERNARFVTCACCGRGDKTLLNREGEYVCRECYAEVLKFRLMKACGMGGALTEKPVGKGGGAERGVSDRKERGRVRRTNRRKER